MSRDGSAQQSTHRVAQLSKCLLLAFSSSSKALLDKEPAKAGRDLSGQGNAPFVERGFAESHASTQP